MSTSALRSEPSTGLRRWMAVLGLLAALVVLIQPVCAAAELAGGHEESEPCCASLKNLDSVPSVQVAVVSAADVEAQVLVLPTAPGMRALPSRETVEVSDLPPPRPLPYYARSARLLI